MHGWTPHEEDQDEREARNFQNPMTAMPRPSKPTADGSGTAAATGPVVTVPVTLKTWLPVVQD